MAPFLDTGKERRFYKRPIATTLMFLSLITISYLTYTSWAHYQHELTEKGLIPEHIKREEAMHAAKGGAGGGNEGASKPSKAAAIVAADDPGAELYKKATCIACHQPTLKGNPSAGAPSLLGIGDKYSKEELTGIIKTGSMQSQYKASMDKGLTDADIDKLINWLSLQKKAQ
ncbi:Cytochrome c [compost metagenome]